MIGLKEAGEDPDSKAECAHMAQADSGVLTVNSAGVAGVRPSCAMTPSRLTGNGLRVRVPQGAALKQSQEQN